jgi:hypothetical protein
LARTSVAFNVRAYRGALGFAQHSKLDQVPTATHAQAAMCGISRCRRSKQPAVFGKQTYFFGSIWSGQHRRLRGSDIRRTAPR